MNQDNIQKLQTAINELVAMEIKWAIILQGSQLPEHFPVMKRLHSARRRVARMLEAEWMTTVKETTAYDPSMLRIGLKLIEKMTDMRLNSTDRYTAEKELNRVMHRLDENAREATAKEGS